MSRFRVLFRHSLFRSVDPELIASGSDTDRLISNGLGVLVGASFTIALLRIFTFADLPDPSMRPAIMMRDLHFMALLSMLAGALIAGIGADTLFPDRKDAYVLGPLPVRRIDILRAKMAALLVLPGVTLVALNFFTGLLFPMLGAGLFTYWGFVLGAGLWAYALFVLLMSLVVIALPLAWRHRVQPILQLVWILTALAAFLVLRDASPLPPLPIALPATALVAALLYIPAFGKAFRAAVEGTAPQPDVPGWISRAVRNLLHTVWLRTPAERAVFWFITRTMTRSSRHRLILAIYAGAAFVFIIEAVEWVFLQASGSRPATTGALLITPLNTAFFLLVGLRMLFTIPVDLQANWVFRLTEHAPRAPYLRGARKFAVLFAVIPCSLVPIPFLMEAIGIERALQQAAFTLLASLIILERLLTRFPKIPFTASYQPGRANVKVKLGVWMIWYMFLSSVLSAILQRMSVAPPVKMYWTLAAMAAIWIVLYWRNQGRERVLPAFVFDDVRESDLLLLRLRA